MQSHLSACFDVAHRMLIRLLAVLVLLASFALVPTGSALAAEITFVSVVGSWRDPVDSVPGVAAGRSCHHERQPDLEYQLGHNDRPAKWL